MEDPFAAHQGQGLGKRLICIRSQVFGHPACQAVAAHGIRALRAGGFSSRTAKALIMLVHLSRPMRMARFRKLWELQHVLQIGFAKQRVAWQDVGGASSL